MPPRHPAIARALGELRRCLADPPAPGPALADLRGQRLVVACSGGADSLALLGLLELLAPGLELRLAVAHVDHGLRPESAAEAAAVLALAHDRGHPAGLRRLHLEVGPGLPARAREARRRALRELAAELGGAWIALGHTATDQAETVLMHLIRGAGLDGLAGMPARDPPWLRPLLRLTRGETAILCGHLGLVASDDPTNADRRHLRVELREEVLPRLRRHNPGLERSITALAAHAAAADEALTAWSAREEELRRRPAEVGRLRWSIAGFAALPQAIRLGLLRRIALRGGADREALGDRILRSIDRALVAWDAAGIAGGEDSGRARHPRTWDLRPHLRLGVDRCGLWTAAPTGPDGSQACEPQRNH